MKSTVIITMAVVIVGGLFGVAVIYDQSKQIQTLQQSESLQITLDNCNQQVLYDLNQSYNYGLSQRAVDIAEQASIDHNKCLDDAFLKYGTDEQMDYWFIQQVQKETKKQNLEDYKQIALNLCRETWIGQLAEYNECIENIEWNYP